MIWVESPSNPNFNIVDLRAVASIAHDKNRKILLAVDNTLLTSYFQRPLEFGVDIVMYSLTKYMNGHDDVLMGSLVCNDEEMFKQLQQSQWRYGDVPSGFDCYLVNRGLKTLAFRMEQHCKNSSAVARYLESHPKVVWVKHTSLKSHPQYDLAQKQSTGHCGLVTFQLKGSIDEVKVFIKKLRIVLSAASFGSYTSYITLP